MMLVFFILLIMLAPVLVVAGIHCMLLPIMVLRLMWEILRLVSEAITNACGSAYEDIRAACRIPAARRMIRRAIRAQLESGHAVDRSMLWELFQRPADVTYGMCVLDKLVAKGIAISFPATLHQEAYYALPHAEQPGPKKPYRSLPSERPVP